MESTTTVVIDVDPIDPGQSIGFNEEMIYQYYFKTSKFNSYVEKISSAEITHEIANAGYYIGEYPLLSLQLEEGFDVFDIKGEIREDGTIASAPRFKFFCEDEYETSLNKSATTVSGTIPTDLNSSSFTNDASSAQNRYFNMVKNGWDDFREDASPIWQECSIPGDCWYLHNISYSNSIAYNGEMYNDATTVYSHFHDPSINFNLNYYEEGPLELSFNDFITGYDDPISDTEIENAWSTHLANQDAIESMNDKFKNGTDVVPNDQAIGAGYGNFETSNNSASSPNNIEDNSTVDMNSSVNYMSNNVIISDSHNNYGVNDNITGTSNNNSNNNTNIQEPNPVQLSIPFKLHPEAENDAYNLWNYGYDLYFEYIDVRFDYEILAAPPSNYIDITETIPKLKWQNLIRDEYPSFKTAFLEKEDREPYYLKENKGNYFLKIQGNKGFSPDHIGGNKKSMKFKVD